MVMIGAIHLGRYGDGEMVIFFVWFLLCWPVRRESEQMRLWTERVRHVDGPYCHNATGSKVGIVM